MSKDKKNQESEKKSNPNFEKKNVLEWSVFVLGLIMIVGVLIYLSYKTYTHKPTPADIKVEFSLDPTPNAPYRYQLLVHNLGGATAENVLVELSLQKADSILEKSEITFQYVPNSSKREGWIIFSENPAHADSVVSKVVSFKAPS